MSLLRLDDAIVVVRPLGEVPDDALTPAERGLADGAGSDPRRRELRAGRAAAKAALLAADASFVSRSVVADDRGRPVLDPPAGDAISLAHDGGSVAAAYALAPVGIDLFSLDRLAQAERVVTARLARDAPPFTGAAGLPWPAPALLWTAWEAAGKRSGDGVLSRVIGRTWTIRRFETLWGATAGDTRVRWFEERGCLVCLATALPGPDGGA